MSAHRSSPASSLFLTLTCSLSWCRRWPGRAPGRLTWGHLQLLTANLMVSQPWRLQPTPGWRRVNKEPPELGGRIRGFSARGRSVWFPGAEHLHPASTSGWSCTVTNRLLLEKLPTGSQPQIQSPPPDCNRFRLILCLFVVLCLMQLHKFPGLSPKEPEWGR